LRGKLDQILARFVAADHCCSEPMRKAIAPYAVLVVAGLALFSDPVAGAQVLAAEELKKKIAALSVPREEEILERRKTAQIVENDLSRFIVHGLQTRSANGECDVERQLRNLFNEESSVACHGADSGLTEAPQVFMQEIGAGRRQVIVMYELYLACMVEGCTVPVFENYLYENGKARRTVRLDSFLNGYLTQRELLGSSAETHQFLGADVCDDERVKRPPTRQAGAPAPVWD
jgi:hypothetical protein